MHVTTVTAIEVDAAGHRKVLGCAVISSEDGAGRTACLRDLVACGPSGVRLVVAADHTGLKQAVAAVLLGAGWQRRRTYDPSGGCGPPSLDRRLNNPADVE